MINYEQMDEKLNEAVVTITKDVNRRRDLHSGQRAFVIKGLASLRTDDVLRNRARVH